MDNQEHVVKNILLIEDDPLMSDLYRNIFELEGYIVNVAADGQDGLDQAKATNPDLILLDIMMPKMDGFQVLAYLKTNPDTSGIPVVILSNLADTQKVDHALQNGAAKYIIKSDHNPDEVVKIVEEVLAPAMTKVAQES